MLKGNSIIGKNIKKYKKNNRKNKCISQDKLSELGGVIVHTITKIESSTTSDPKIDTVKNVGKARNVSFD